jgi:asparagine synthase (glutamine-hydrolysing)
MIYTDIQTFLPDDYLTKVDRTSMAHGLEVRVPMLDPNLLVYSFFLPSSYKVRGTQTKVLLRQALKGVLPNEILQRKKMGFEVPLDSWLRGKLRRTVEEKLFQPTSFVSQLLNIQQTKHLWENFLQKKYKNANLIWSLLILELWWNEHKCRIRHS